MPLPPITYNFYLRKLRFLRKVRKSMSFKMILNSHNSLFAHIFFNSHFIRCQRLKEQGASSHGLSADKSSYLLKSPQKSIARLFLPENQYSILIYATWRKWRNGGSFFIIPPLPPFPSPVHFLPRKRCFFAKMLAYVHFLLYLCARNGGQIATLMQTFIKNNIHYEVFNS